jgi:predicted NUDIX family phosphoesterase
LNVDFETIKWVFDCLTVLEGAEAMRVSETFTSKGNFASRERVEMDPTRIQALPVLVIRNSKGDVLQLRRKERDRKNSLHNQLVLWAGGHVRQEDGTNGKAVMHCLLREAKEELKLNIAESEPQFLGAIWERHATPKTAQHVALVFEWRAQSEDVEVCLSNAEFYERRGTSLSGRFVATSELVGKKIDEPWSSVILENLLTDVRHSVQERLL